MPVVASMAMSPKVFVSVGAPATTNVCRPASAGVPSVYVNDTLLRMFVPSVKYQ